MPRPIPIEHEGRRITLNALAAELGMETSTLWRRYREGLRGADLVRPSYTRAQGKKAQREYDLLTELLWRELHPDLPSSGNSSGNA